jgi:hypothetical protein
MLKYKYIIRGQNKIDGLFYKAECLCNGMSKYEIEEWIKDNNFDPETVRINVEKA